MRFFQSLPRFWRTFFLFLGLSFTASPVMDAKASSSIAVFEWTIAEALLSLDAPSVLMGNVAAFDNWTGNDYADADITDIGTQLFPNMELLSSIAPEHIFLVPRQTRLKTVLAEISTSDIVQSYPYTNNSNNDLWSKFDAFILEVGDLSGRRVAAEQLIKNTQSHLASLKDDLEPQPPLLVVQFITEQYVRVYGDRSVFQGALDRLGLQNAWKRDTDTWGRSLVSIRELFDVHLEDARLVVMESAFPIGIENNIENSGMWRYLPSVQRGDFVVLPSTFWIGGVHPSALRFADALVEALEEPTTP
ncbi:ABC transporter substrate-binding protein [Vreelandella neptunia]|uniref:ABC transporter substrate-binding protein n=1 Tax=Vreelandella neptunia TaxID=115551 RepID=UPI00315A77E9